MKQILKKKYAAVKIKHKNKVNSVFSFISPANQKSKIYVRIYVNKSDFSALKYMWEFYMHNSHSNKKNGPESGL